MKYLLILLLAFPLIGVGQKRIDSLITGFRFDSKGAFKEWLYDKWEIDSSSFFPERFYRTDTIPSSILISHKAPSFGHGIDGYCLYQYGVCTKKHLRYWRKRWVVIGPEYIVWGCTRRDKK